MQPKGLPKNIYKLYAYARTQECLDAYRKKYEDSVRKWIKLRAEGVKIKTCQEIVGISRATYFRYKNILSRLKRGIMPPSRKPKHLRKPKWGDHEIKLVLQIRRESPTYGKAKIVVILRRDHNCFLSESTVGRILSHLFNKGLIQKSASAVRVKRKRNFVNKHAKPWTFKDYKTMVLGERVQIDHMTATQNGVTCKEFHAWDRRSKFVDAQIYSNATSRSAKKFLVDYIKKVPFKVRSIQVDGGSEFMAEFEEACQDMDLELLVLPPAKPTYNGGVERSNKVFKEEFYRKPNLLADSIGALRAELKQAVEKYNAYRPHGALNGLTPLEYIKQHIQVA